MDPRKWSLRLKKGEGDQDTREGEVLQSFVQLLFLITVFFVRIPTATRRVKPPLL